MMEDSMTKMDFISYQMAVSSTWKATILTRTGSMRQEDVMTQRLAYMYRHTKVTTLISTQTIMMN